MNFEIFDRIIESQSDVVSFGSQTNAPTDEWLAAAEQALGANFPPSYKEFLAKYGGGEIRGDEIFSVYGVPFDQVVGGDVVYQTLLLREGGRISDSDIAVCTTDYGECFVLDSSEVTANGEFAVVRIVGGKRCPYAPSFIAFLVQFAGNE